MSLFARFAFVDSAEQPKPEVKDEPKPRKIVNKHAEAVAVGKRKREPCEAKIIKMKKSTPATVSNTVASAAISSAVQTEVKPEPKSEPEPKDSYCAKRFRLSNADCDSTESLVMEMKRKHQTRLAELAVIMDYRQNKGATVDDFNSFLLSLGSPQLTNETEVTCKTENPSGEASAAEPSVVERRDDRSHGRYWALIACLLSVQCRDGKHKTHDEQCAHHKICKCT